MTIDTLANDVANRLEEVPGDTIFWSTPYEIYPTLVDAMYEAALLTGFVQANNVLVTLPPNTTYFSLQNNTAIGIPKGVFAALRMRAPYPIRKVSLKGLGDIAPGWQNTPPATQLRGWFPLGVSMFGVWPQLTAEAQVIMDFLVSPVTVARPYAGTINVPFPEEFTSAFPEYSATILRAKEMGAEAQESAPVFEAYLDKMKRLSMYQSRLDSLVFAKPYGANLQVTRREKV